MLMRPWVTPSEVPRVRFYLITQSSGVPIVCFDAKRRVLLAMTANVKLDDRLLLLRAGDRFRRWKSLDDQRVCSVCERKFKGRQVEIRRFAGGRYELYCPTLGCPSGPHQWLYPRGAVVFEIAELGWSYAGKRPLESTPQTYGHRI